MRITSLSPLVALALAACGLPDSPALELGPAEATTTDDLALTLTAPADADAEDHYEVVWTRDGEVVSDYADALVVPSSATAKGELWVATVTPVNKRDRAGISVSAEITILNTPPTATVSIADEIALTTEDLVATATSDDVDGDEVALTWTWLRDGEKTGYTGDTVPASETVKGEVWTVVVSPADDEVSGLDVEASVSIDNSFPVADAVTLSPAEPAVTDVIVASAEGHDEDGDALSWSYSWSVDGVVVDGETGPELPAGSFSKGQVVSVVAVPNDGFVDGEGVSAQVTAVNSAPSLESAYVDPSLLREADSASCVPAGWSDADGDAAGYQLAWRVNGTEVSSEGTLSGSSFDKGDSVVCVLTPDDGEALGAPVASEAVVVSNTPPVLGAVAYDSSAPKTGDDLTASVSGVSDVDGDAVSFSYAWSVNGSVVLTEGTSSASSTLSGSYYAKGDSVSVVVTPGDGDDLGSAVAGGSVTVANTAPVVGAVALDLSAPATDDVITASASGVDDVDGDSVSLTWSWSVNGSVVATETTSGTSSSLDGGTYFSSGDVVRVSVVPGDGTDSGSSVASSSVTVVNTVPSLDSVALSPASPAIGDDVVATASGGSDIDGDTITYTYAWSIDGSEVFSESSTATTSTLASSYTAKGSSITVSVTPSDADGDGSAVVSSAVSVVNTAPVASGVAFDTSTPDTDDVITATVSASDADGDSLTFAWSWTVDGSEVFTETTSGTSSSLDGASYFDKGQVIVATATPDDGDGPGTAATSASVTVVNAAPVLSSVSLASTDLTTSTDASVSGFGYSDADGDSVTATYAWTVNGSAAGTGSTLASTEFVKDDVLQVTVTIDDGTDTDSLASASVTVGNTAPTAAAVAIDPASPTDADDLLCDVTTAATDVDGDSLSYEVVWTKDGSEWTGATSTTVWADDTVLAADLGAGETWSCSIVAYDGTDYGPSADSADVTLGLGGTPPAGFTGTVGRISGDGWKVCRADASTAWVAANSGGTYNAVETCQYLGYTGVNAQGGTCGTVCGYCGTAGAETYDGGGGSPTSMSFTVHWRCYN